MQQDLWQIWQASHVQSLEARHKWLTKERDFQVGDIVYLKDKSLNTRSWPLAKITAIFPGDDGHVRAVDVLCRGNTYHRPSHKLVFLFDKDQLSAPPVCSGLEDVSEQEKNQ